MSRKVTNFTVGAIFEPIKNVSFHGSTTFLLDLLHLSGKDERDHQRYFSKAISQIIMLTGALKHNGVTIS